MQKKKKEKKKGDAPLKSWTSWARHYSLEGGEGNGGGKVSGA